MTIDYRSFRTDGQSGQTPQLDRRWWLAPKDERAAAVFAVIRSLDEADSQRQTQYQTTIRLYGNADLMGMNGLSFSKVAPQGKSVKDRITYNVCQSATDTVTAKIAKNKPKPLFLTSGGDQKMQRKAKKLDKFVEGIFYENQAYRLGTTLFRDSCVLGDGVAHVFEHNGRVKFERVLPGELKCDWVEAFYGEPRQFHRVKAIDRQVLIELYPEKADLLRTAKSASSHMSGSVENIADQIVVAESWHLASGPEASDGVHSINIEEGNLFDDTKWKKRRFPFAFLPWSKRLYGFWSQSLIEQIQNIQLEINKILWVIQRSFHLAGTFKVFLQNGSKVVKEHLNNDIGAIVTYNGTEPKYVVPPIVPMEIYQHLQTLKSAAYEQAGISQLSANSQKPAGLNSGKALREFNDIESERFMTVGQAYENFYLDLAALAIDCAKDIYGDKKSYEVKVPGKRFIESIDWKEVDLDEDQYVMKCYPVSSLPNDPAGRLQTIQEYMQAGLIDPITGKRLLDFPDLERMETLSDAQEEWILSVLDGIADQGKYNPPEPEMNLDLAKSLVLQYIAYGNINKLAHDRLDSLRTWNTQLDDLKARAAAQAQGQGAPGQPMAAPEPQPQSDLIPNVNPQPGAA